MSTLEIIALLTAIIALLTAVVLITTLLYIRRQLVQMRIQMQAQMYADLIDKDRELAKYFIEHPDITKTIYGEGNTLYGKDATESQEIWSTILAADWYENLFVQYNFEAIPKELMPHWKMDIAKGWVQSKAYGSEHWKNVKEMYWEKFRDLCDEIAKEEQQIAKGKDTESKTLKP